MEPGSFVAVDGATNLTTTLANVTTLRILHNPIAAWRGVNIAAAAYAHVAPPPDATAREIAGGASLDRGGREDRIHDLCVGSVRGA